MSNALKKKPIVPSEISSSDEEGKLRIVGPQDLDQRNPLEHEFKLKSEFFEKNVVVPEIDRENSSAPITQVKVYREDGIDIVDPQQLKSFIKDNKGIKQVVVEKISIDEATRVSLLFEPKTHASQFTELVEESLELLDQEEPQGLEKSFSLDELENFVNESFLKEPTPEKNLKDQISEEIKTEKVEVVDEPSEKPKQVKFGLKTKRDLQVVTTEESHEEEGPSHSGTSEKEGKSGLSLKLKDHGKSTDGSLKYEKHTFTRKKSRSGHAYYYRAKDHVELYKVGSSFLKDFNSGLKSFSFSSSGLKEEREKSVLGILSFFNYHEDLRICVITSSLEDSFYGKIAIDAQKREAQVFDEDLTYEFYTGEGYEIIEFQELKKVERKITAYNFEDFLDQILSSFDLILWDLPEIEILDSNKELYFPIIRSLDNVSFIVGKNVSKISEINEMISYFKRYQIPIKGLLLSDPLKKGEDKK